MLMYISDLSSLFLYWFKPYLNYVSIHVRILVLILLDQSILGVTYF